MSLFSDLRRALLSATVKRGLWYAWLLCVSWSTALPAQTPPAPAASTPIADHVKRAAERPFYWIKRNAQTPEPTKTRPKTAQRPATRLAPPSAEVAASAPIVTSGRDSGITERVTPLLGNSPAASAANTSLDRQDLNATLEIAPPAAGPAPSPASTEPTPTPEVPASGPLPISTDAEAPSDALKPSSSRALVPNEAEVSNSLRLLSQVEPEFPGPLQRRLRKGSVELSFTVLPDGSVSAPSVLRSSHPRLEAPALAAVAQWRFAPLAVAKTGVVEVGFNLDP